MEVVTCGVNETVVSAFGVPVKVDVLLNDVNTDDIYVSFAAKTWQMIRNCKTICRQRVGICLATNLFLVKQEDTVQEDQKLHSFDWYLLFSGDDNSPKSCNVKGNKKSHEIELFEDTEVLSFACCDTGCNKRKEVIRKYTQIGYFTLNLDDAKEYLYAKSTKRRILSWRDIHVNVFI